MSIEEDIFRKRKVNKDKLTSYGFKKEGDLYVIGVDYYLPNANCKGIDSPIVWVSTNGKINQTYYAMDAYTRPVVYLKEEVKTTGQDKTGAYLVAE